MGNENKKNLIRQKMLQARCSLTTIVQKNAADKLCQLIINLPLFKQSQHIALYWPYKAEINPIPILKAALAANKCCYLPVLDPNKEKNLLFMPYNLDTILINNKYGIAEPDYNYDKVISIEQLSVTFLPLVAFDAKGYRLGMGGGYYDTTLAKIHDIQKPPLCIGLAYAMQEIDMIPLDHWDLKLDGVVTEIECKIFNKCK